MSYLPGRVVWEPSEIEPWLDGLVGVLATVHDTPLPSGHGIADFRPYAPERWQPPPWMRRRSLWERALDVFGAAPLDPERPLIHRHYHPGNVLWRGHTVSGVVDWQAASLGPPSVDVSWCRLNILGTVRLGGGRPPRPVLGRDHRPHLSPVRRGGAPRGRSVMVLGPGAPAVRGPVADARPETGGTRGGRGREDSAGDRRRKP